MHTEVLAGRLRLVGAVALLAALFGFVGWMYAANWRPRVSDFAVQGVDVTEDDGPIDWWQAKKSGVRFVYARATAGAAHRDLRFAEHWRGAAAANLKRGAIHLYSLCQPAMEQAGNFVSTVPRIDAQLPAAVELDFQSDCSARPDRAILLGELGRFLAAMETHLGQHVVLKVSKRFEAHYRISETTSRPLWSKGAFFPPAYLARPWRMWQASSFRRIEGAGKPVNWDVMAR